MVYSRDRIKRGESKDLLTRFSRFSLVPVCPVPWGYQWSLGLPRHPQGRFGGAYSVLARPPFIWGCEVRAPILLVRGLGGVGTPLSIKEGKVYFSIHS
jgi:hypothetical protein